MLTVCMLDLLSSSSQLSLEWSVRLCFSRLHSVCSLISSLNDKERNPDFIKERWDNSQVQVSWGSAWQMFPKKGLIIKGKAAWGRGW